MAKSAKKSAGVVEMKKVAVIGSGNFGTAVARHVARNIRDKKDLAAYDKEVRMWVFEEVLKDGRKLTEIINTDHINVKYLPNVTLPENLVAVPSVAETIRDASLIILVPPHQFVRGVSRQIAAALTPDQKKRLVCLSLAKGIEFDPKKKRMRRMTQVFQDETGAPDARMAALSGANIANEMARDFFAETTIASPSSAVREELYSLFHTDNFTVELSRDIAGVELGGALKNVVAIAAGIIDGLGFGNNTKAAVIRMGLVEMMQFGAYKQLGHLADQKTFLGSAGIGDLLTTCYGGRNRLVGEAIGRLWRTDPDRARKLSIDTLEKELLGGQKVQGVHTAEEVFSVLKAFKLTSEFPVFVSVYAVCVKGRDPRTVYRRFEEHLDEVVDLVSLVRDDLAAYARVQEAHCGVHIHIKTSLRAALVNGEKALMKTILTRILGKAARHARRGSVVTVTVSSDRSAYRVNVTNEGKGIALSALPAATKKMAATAAAVERLGGRFYIESKSKTVDMGIIIPKA